MTWLMIVLAALFNEPLAEERAMVEKIRGLKFTALVAQKTITRAELRTYLIGQLEKELPVPVADYLRVLDALELIDNESGTLDRLLALYEAQVLAFYDPPTDMYYSLSEPPKGIELNELMTRGVAVHELMHALQDQRFGAGDRLFAMRGNSDAQLAYQAVLEGEAMLVMMGSVLESMGQTLDAVMKHDAFFAALSTAANLDVAIPENVPRYFVESMKFPYLEGMNFVAAAYRRGGWDAVDALHQNPPISTEEIFHPEQYFSRPPSHVPRPASKPFRHRTGDEGRGTIKETMGEFTWNFLLGEKAAEGWSSDTVVVENRDSGKLSVRVETAWDSESDAREFADAYREFLSSRSIDATVTRQKRQVNVSYLTR